MKINIKENHSTRTVSESFVANENVDFDIQLESIEVEEINHAVSKDLLVKVEENTIPTGDIIFLGVCNENIAVSDDEERKIVRKLKHFEIEVESSETGAINYDIEPKFSDDKSMDFDVKLESNRDEIDAPGVLKAVEECLMSDNSIRKVNESAGLLSKESDTPDMMSENMSNEGDVSCND